MNISYKGLRLIKECEGLRLSPYTCSAGVPTIGYGSTGDHVTLAMDPITKEEANCLLRCDIANSMSIVSQKVSVDLNQNQYDALVSFVYNIGSGNFSRSTLLRYLNKGDYEAAENEFWKWRRGGGEILPGLVKRRELERQLFTS